MTGEPSFGLDDIAPLANALVRNPNPNDLLSYGVLRLPRWFELDLDPHTDEYRNQQLRLWREIAGASSDYSAATNEMYPHPKLGSPFSRAAIFRSGSAAHAGEHFIAIGNILKHSGVKVGSRVMEYGPGFGEIAFTFARIGAIVDAVDINPSYCDAINNMARLSKTPLKAHVGLFGHRPDPTIRYDLIYFYEAFHHSITFAQIIPELKQSLSSFGSVILAGEPVHMVRNAALPYPWGLRLDAASVATTRAWGWMELGFDEQFLTDLFVRSGFAWQHFQVPGNALSSVYKFKPRPRHIPLTGITLTSADESTWHVREPAGRWSRARSRLPLDATASAVRTHLRNPHGFPNDVHVISGGHKITRRLKAGELSTMEVTIDPTRPELVIAATTHRPSVTSSNPDHRELGVFVTAIEYP